MKSLIEISVRRPVFTWMAMVGVVVFGFLAFWRLGVSQLPDVDYPVVNVSVTWPGASPEIMESAVSDVVEDTLMSVAGIREMRTQCFEGISNTTLEFDIHQSIDSVVQDVQSRLGQIQRKLPADADPPIVTKVNPEDQPILRFALTGPQSLREKVVLFRNRIKDQITTVDGVADLQLGGFVDPVMRIDLDPKKLEKNQLIPADLSGAIRAGSVLVPSGTLTTSQRDVQLKISSEADRAEVFRKIPITSRGGAPIWSKLTIADVASVNEGLGEVRRIARYDGKSAVTFGVIKQRGSNAIGVADRVQERIKKLTETLPAGASLELIADSTQFIRESTHELYLSLSLAVILTSLVCALFLGSWSASFNVVLAIPVSLLGAFFILWKLNYTLNSFTLLALSLSIGIVVDDAIMVLENISHYREKGLGLMESALTGAKTVSGAAIASTLAVLAIFAPVLFVDGMVGQYLLQFGVTLSVAVAFSLFEALTFAPMRCAQFFSEATERFKLTQKMDVQLERLKRFYSGVLEHVLKSPRRWAAGSVLLSLVSFGALRFIPKELVPAQDQGRFLTTIQARMDSSLEATDQLFRVVEYELKKIPEIEHLFSAVGGFQGGLVNQGNLFILLKPKSERKRTQLEVMNEVRERLKAVPGVVRSTTLDLSLSVLGGGGGGRSYPFSFQLQGPHWEALARDATLTLERLKKSGLFADIDSDYRPARPELALIPDAERLVYYNLTMDQVTLVLSQLYAGERIGKYNDSTGRRSDVFMKIAPEVLERKDPFAGVFLRNRQGELIPLAQVVDQEERKTLFSINRVNRARTISFYGTVKTGIRPEKVREFVEKNVRTELSKEALITYGNKEESDTFKGLLIALLLGFVMAYMILAAQYNDYLYPIAVLSVIPLSFAGAFLAMLLTRTSLNLFSSIGILLLMGIVKKNSILIVDFTIQRVAEGGSVLSALLEAAPDRLRPILMTSFATVAAAIPTALSIGSGSEVVKPMSWVIIGGVSFSLVLTLIVVPCFVVILKGKYKS